MRTIENTLLIIKEGTAYDISDLIERYQWSGRNNAPARSLKVTLLDDDGSIKHRSGIDIEQGQHCIFLHNGKELFRGMFMRQEQNYKRMMTLIAYDNGIYLSNNRDSFSYTDKTASFIFKDVCGRFQIPYADIAEHVFSGGTHTMKLKLTPVEELDTVY